MLANAVITLSYLTCICLIASIITFYSAWKVTMTLDRLQRAAKAKTDNRAAPIVQMPIKSLAKVMDSMQHRNRRLEEELQKQSKRLQATIKNTKVIPISWKRREKKGDK